MSILNLPPLFQRAAADGEEAYVALVIYPQSAEVAIWKDARGHAKILGTGFQSADSWEEAAEKALQQAQAAAQSPSTKVIFGVPDDWIEGGSLHADVAEKLRAVSRTAHLVPTSFVSTVRAIAHSQKLTEGMSLTAIVVGVDHKSCEISLWQTGRLVGVTFKEQLESIPQAIDESIKSFGSIEVLPARILLYGAHNLEQVKQDLLAYPWMQRLNFLHFPKVDIVPEGTAAASVALAGAADIGSAREKTFALGQQTTPSGKPFGFVRGKDIGRQPQRLPESEPASPRYVAQSTPVVGPPRTAEAFKPGVPVRTDPGDSIWERITERVGVWPLRAAIIASMLGLLSVGVAALYYNLPKATVTLLLTPEVLERDTQLLISPDAREVNVGAKIIPGFRFTASQKAGKTGVASGKKTVGDAAKGEVVIFNKSSTVKKLSKGLTLTAQGSGLKFQLERDIDVASQSATTNTDESVTLVPGKAKVSVTATEIGDNGNLAAGIEFAVGTFSLDVVKGKSESALTGGTSREVSVVTKQDQEKVVNELSKEMFDKGKDELSQKVAAGQLIIPESVKQEIVKKSFDRDVDKEGSDMTVTLETAIAATAYNETELKELLAQSVASAVPEGFELLTEAVDTETQVARVEDNGKVTLKVHFRANLLPVLRDDEIKQAIAGKTLREARESLLSLPRVAEVSFQLWPKLPEPLLRLPYRKERLSLQRSHK